MPAIKLDKKRPFGSIRGEVDGYVGVSFIQDGKYFSRDGELARKAGQKAVDFVADASKALDEKEANEASGDEASTGDTSADIVADEKAAPAKPAPKKRAPRKPKTAPAKPAVTE
ncbi:MAG: hypothetical protein ACJA1I_000500 [Zhongshania marina]|jgi:hypothetical protein